MCEGGPTEVVLINVLYPVGEKSIWDDEKVEFGDEFSFSGGILGGKPLDLVPFSLGFAVVGWVLGGHGRYLVRVDECEVVVKRVVC